VGLSITEHQVIQGTYNYKITQGLEQDSRVNFELKLRSFASNTLPKEYLVKYARGSGWVLGID
jgi:hypothetical protein